MPYYVEQEGRQVAGPFPTAAEALASHKFTDPGKVPPLGVHEIAQLAGVKPDTVQKWRGRGFPAPDWQLACGPIWSRETVTGWLERTGRSVSL